MRAITLQHLPDEMAALEARCMDVNGGLLGYMCSDEYAEAFRHGTADPRVFGGQFPIVAVLPKGTTVTLEALIHRGGDVGGWSVEFSAAGSSSKRVEAPDEFFSPNEFLSTGRGFPQIWKVSKDVVVPATTR